jgi:hypothetical protein
VIFYPSAHAARSENMEPFGLGLGLFIAIPLLVFIVVAIGMIKTFAKMGYDDAWWCIIPILNFFFFLKVIEKPWWWILLLLIPMVGGIFSILVFWLLSSKVAKAFGKTDAFAIGLLFLGFIFYPMLGFGEEQPQVSV